LHDKYQLFASLNEYFVVAFKQQFIENSFVEWPHFYYDSPMSKANTIHSNSALQALGLSEQESRFYIAALTLGKSPVSKIAREANLNRSSVYTIVERLAEKGLISRGKTSTGLAISAASPKHLLTLQEEQAIKLAKHVEQLQDLFVITKAEPGVRFYEGPDGLKNVLTMILEEAKEVCAFGDGDAFRKAIPGWTERYSERRSAQKIHTRLLLKATPQTIGAAKYLRSSQPDEKKAYSKIRLLPEALGIKGGFDVYNNTVILYSFDEKNVAVVVESMMISLMMKAIFEILWEMAEGYEKTLIR
jgi:sugar-specific transcriptional regulator TrmB